MLMELAIQDIIKYIMNDHNVDWTEAMRRFYVSDTMEKLSDADTGLYRESSAYVYDLYKNEAHNGRIIQNEI
ncbi:MAG: hypothetical protein IJH37_11520 [Clostridia bacterium]|nr:hypothetical protein [Clostridia bacterium]